MAEARLLDRRDAVALARFLDEPREAFGTKVTIAERDKNGRVIGARDAHVWHCSLSLHPQEPELADERWAEIAEAFIEQMGFAGERAKAQCRWVAIRHGRSAGGSDHAHLVVHARGRGREQGQRAQRPATRPERVPRARAAVRAARVSRRAPARQAAAALKHGELAADRRRGRGVGERGGLAERSSRQTLERIVRACATASRDETEFVRRLRDARRPSSAPATPRAAPSEVVGYSVKTPRHRAWPARERVVRRRPPRPRPDPPGAAARLAPRRRGAAAGGHRVGLVDVGRGARSPAERQAELEQRGLMWHRCTTGAGARPPAAPRRRRRPRRDRACRPRRRRRPRRLVDRARGRAARRARPRRPAARPLRRAARPHPGPAEAAVARVRAGAVHARRRQARQRRRMADRLARDRAPRRRARPRAPRPRRARPRPADRERARRRARADRSQRSSASGRARTRSSTPKRRPPSAPASRCRRRRGIPDAQSAEETEDIKRLINPLRGRRTEAAVGPPVGRHRRSCSWRGARLVCRPGRHSHSCWRGYRGRGGVAACVATAVSALSRG